MYEIRKMETDMELLEEVLPKDNLNRVYKQVYKNKGKSGDDGISIDELFSYIEEHKEEILRKQEVLTSIYEEQFSNNSYGFRLICSCEMAVIKTLECFIDGYDWIVDIDLQSSYDEVNQDKLIRIIIRIIKDGDLVSLIRKFLQSGLMGNGVLQPTKKETPQGG